MAHSAHQIKIVMSFVLFLLSKPKLKTLNYSKFDVLAGIIVCLLAAVCFKQFLTQHF